MLTSQQRNVPIAVWAALVTVAGCVPPTVIYPRNAGPPFDVQVESSDPSALRVRDAAGSALSLGQDDVCRMYHRRNLWVPVGLTFVGVALVDGGAFLAPEVDAWLEHRQTNRFFEVVGIGGVLVGLVGSAIAIYEANAIEESRAAASAFEQARPLPLARPRDCFPQPRVTPPGPSVDPEEPDGPRGR